MLIYVSAKSQGWQPGSYTDVNGKWETGMIRRTPNQPVKDEAAVEFRGDKSRDHIILSAGDLKSIVMGRDSFVVAAAPQTSAWRNYLDFVKVAFDEDEDLKLFVFQGYATDGGIGGSGVTPEFGVGIGGAFGGGRGAIGGGVGGGISIPIGGHGGRRSNYAALYYYGDNTAHMKRLTPANFVDIMSEMLGDQADIVDALHQNKYDIGSIDKLLRDYKKAEKAGK